MAKFWKASAEVAAIVHRIVEEEDEARGAALKLSRKYGGSRTGVYTRRSWGDQSIVGFKFPKREPDTRLFKRLKNTPDGWSPRLSTKEGKEIEQQLRGLATNGVGELCKAIKMDQFKGLRLRTPGLRVIGQDVYLELPDDVTPPGCKRVSDVEMETIIAAGNKDTK